ncbi:unnamed protein product (macronuclear) [Paramecium tetraurelia]|uniref:Transmembrane protein n=1 Tax=Paramecium tetraurelia TaxID=5888 RepID=A0EFV0_PARTE|nr:uncharacterized protein GSPATT00026514001 [Paramecium tetraurelia]CAK94191.1 unnamed protein product [Paramecium tetraurelia]|eukprot:XP_001461564.1 hypothetical protein (macronuclear) [Paramecium tetraurelia strain d4-2]
MQQRVWCPNMDVNNIKINYCSSVSRQILLQISKMFLNLFYQLKYSNQISMKFSLELSDNTHKVIGFVCSNVVEIVTLAYYATIETDLLIDIDLDKVKITASEMIQINDAENKIKAYKGLSVTGSIFLMITWCLQILLIYRYNQKMLYAIFGINTFSILILLVGMGIQESEMEQVSVSFNAPVAFWFIQLTLYIMSLVNLHNFRQQEGNQNMEGKNQKKEETDDSKKQAQNTSTQANQSQVVMMGNNESQFTQQQQVV